MLALTVSLANEGLENEALNELKKWHQTLRNEENYQKDYFDNKNDDSERVKIIKILLSEMHFSTKYALYL